MYLELDIIGVIVLLLIPNISLLILLPSYLKYYLI
jgi:hypothetical protein